jgi:hypothetical protein
MRCDRDDVCFVLSPAESSFATAGGRNNGSSSPLSSSLLGARVHGGEFGGNVASAHVLLVMNFSVLTPSSGPS